MAGAGQTSGPNNWNNVAGFAGTGECYYNIQSLDLRGLMAGNERGLQPENISLQEAVPWSMPVAMAYMFMVFDFISTVKPTEELIGDIYQRPDLGQNQGVGFPLTGSTLASAWPPSRQRLNPTQITWGLWRQFSMDPNWDTNGASITRVANSGYFGQGDMAVSPALYWTRVVVTMKGEDVVAIPSANLLTYARAEKITAPEEMTAMMRAAQR